MKKLLLGFVGQVHAAMASTEVDMPFLFEVNKQHNYGGKFISLKIILTKEINNLCLQTQLKTK